VRLNKVRIQGFGRLTEGSLDLSPRLIAVVGPNEAGKSTLLEALDYLTSQEYALPLTKRSRTVTVTDDTTVVTGYYVLEEEEAKSFQDLDLEEMPRSLNMARHAGNLRRYMTVTPAPKRSRTIVNGLISDFLARYTPDIIPNAAADDEVEVTEATKEAFDNLLARLHKVRDALGASVSAGTQRETLPDLHDELAALQEETDSMPLPADKQTILTRLINWIEDRDPGPEVRSRLNAMVPLALVFSDADRSLPSTFALDDNSIIDVPVSVQNLSDMAGLDLAALWLDVQQGDRAGHGTKIRTANNILKVKFAQAWRQSDLTVNLDLSGTTLHIDIHQGENIVTPIDERSAGLRMYVALIAFLERQHLDVKPILLIDEAETHLHIDAQADLVASFMRRREVAKIVYTTHSPACLPFDLGTNIRAVLPSRENPQESTLENSFWRNAAGFTPLMIAMGAGAAAFSTARYVVLAEGSTEMLLLPSLIRSATDLEELPYQVAPGLSESAPEDYSGLDLEGAHVAFLVDGDDGGSKLAKGLVKAGVRDKQVVHLGSLMLEHLLDPVVYAAEYRQLLLDWNPGLIVREPLELDLEDPMPWPKQLEQWAKKFDESRIPGKRDVASFLAERGNASPSDTGGIALTRLHAQLMAALGIIS
jgi:predicted ATP-dependent endonuclease of OLD family